MKEEKQSLEFQAYPRKPGSSIARRLRQEQFVPAVVYGTKQKTIPLCISIKQAEKYIKKEYDNKIFTFKSKKQTLNGLKVLKKEVCYHKLTRKPLHIDFFSLDMKKKIRVLVEINFMGKAKGVKESGGVFNVMRRNVEIECLPKDIPEFFSIEITSLDVNQNFHVSDLKIPNSVKLMTNKADSLCAVNEIAEEEVTVTKEATEATVETATSDSTPEDVEKKQEPKSSSGKEEKK